MKTEQLVVRLTEEEARRLKALARAARRTRSDLVRGWITASAVNRPTGGALN